MPAAEGRGRVAVTRMAAGMTRIAWRIRWLIGPPSRLPAWAETGLGVGRPFRRDRLHKPANQLVVAYALSIAKTGIFQSAAQKGLPTRRSRSNRRNAL